MCNISDPVYVKPEPLTAVDYTPIIETQLTYSDLIIDKIAGQTMHKLLTIEGQISIFNEQLRLFKYTADKVGEETEKGLISVQEYSKLPRFKHIAHPKISSSKDYRVKVITEMTCQNYQFRMPTNYTQVYYDIETYNTVDQHLIPKAN